GYLTVPQLAKALASPPHWVYHQIKRGTVAISRDAATGLYLFPARPETLEALRQLQAGHPSAVRYLAPSRPWAAPPGGPPAGGPSYHPPPLTSGGYPGG